MSHFAKINSENIVTQVIVAEQDFIDTLEDSSSYIQTSFNTYGGKHYLANNTNIEDDKPPLRKNFAGIDYTYDSTRDAFIPPQPYPSWTLNEETCLWESPEPLPSKGSAPWVWDEDSKSWKGAVISE